MTDYPITGGTPEKDENVVPEAGSEQPIPQGPNEVPAHPEDTPVTPAAEEIAEEVPAEPEEEMPEPEKTAQNEPDSQKREQPFDLSILDDPELDVPEETFHATEELPDDFMAEAEAMISEPEKTAGEEYVDMDAQPKEQPEEEAPASDKPKRKRREKPVRKGRPRRKKGEGMLGIPNILTTLVWVAIVLAIGVTLGRMAWLCATDVLAFGREDKAVTITVYDSDTIDDIITKLYNNGLIKYPKLFKLYASFAVDDGDIQPGIWDLNTRYDYHAIVKSMAPSSTRSTVTVTIPEGYSCRQIFELLEENKVCSLVDIGSYAATGELDDYWFLEDVERGDIYCLEGYLFPDTYEFYTNDSPRNVLEKMLNNFDTRVTQEIRDELTSLNEYVSNLMRTGGKSEDYIAANQLTMSDVIIVASLIEKETSGSDESPMIASVIYNRLYNWGDNPAYLNIDASIVYAMDGDTTLDAAAMQVDSLYNTYTHTGLTPTPISNPGLASIKAALEPEDSSYYYYVLDTTAGSHIFSTTLEEHEANRTALAEAAAAATTGEG